MRYRFLVAVVASCLGIAGCRDGHPPASHAEPATGAPAEARTPAGPTSRARIHPTLPEFTFTLVGDRRADDGEILEVHAIEIRRAPSVTPFQVIDGLDTATPVAADDPGVAVLDMNFDGYGDIRLVEFRPAGPNVPYLNWLFDPVSGRFVESRALNAITSPRFDPAAGELRSDWRDGPTRYGTDVYVFREGEPVLLRREVKSPPP